MKKFYYLGCCMIIFSVCKAQKVNISLNLKKGAIYKQQIIASSKVSQEFGERKLDITMTIDGSMSYLVKEIEGQDYDMEVSYDSLTMNMQLPQGSMKFSSEDHDMNNIFSKLLSGIKGKPFFMKMSKTGRVSNVHGADSLFVYMLDQFPQLPEAQRKQIQDQVMKAFGNKAFKGNIEAATAVFPDKAVSKGDQWTINTQLAGNIQADLSTVYEYLGQNNTAYLIHGEGKITTADKESPMKVNDMPVKYKLSGALTTDIKVNQQNGWIMAAQINENMNGNVQIEDNPKLPGGKAIPMTINIDETISGK